MAAKVGTPIPLISTDAIRLVSRQEVPKYAISNSDLDGISFEFPGVPCAIDNNSYLQADVASIKTNVTFCHTIPIILGQAQGDRRLTEKIFGEGAQHAVSSDPEAVWGARSLPGL